MKQSFSKILILILFFLIIIAIIKSFKSTKIIHIIQNNPNIESNEKVQVNVFNLKAALKPDKVYQDIPCKKLNEILKVSTTLCLFNQTADVVSNFVINKGMWEPTIVENFLKYLQNNPDWLVIDIGAEIGLFTMFSASYGREVLASRRSLKDGSNSIEASASYGREVLAVEPYYENAFRLHKAINLEKLSHKVTLIQNALSDKRFEIKKLSRNDFNIAGQTLLENKNEVFTREDLKKDKYMVETILFDDITDHIPKKENGDEYKKAVMKIDIEGFEPYAFMNAGRLFDRLDIRVIFMEWGNIHPQKDNYYRIQKMIFFLFERNYQPTGPDGNLDYGDWIHWPWDIIWVKK
ncbi:unnamed protein product [Brachionus calyciflorus]|uniref:Methyltransferase FkbM domain-containing protein n=1 Tax=Brachionus calyciflorus TaxID=104777 RepID=A0A814BL05_9BILA|nr:unnamed protein product [Brachionus calyciflorus]